jgi:lipoprotein-anchoring transpeptidase ErfK/SrfK
MRARDASLPKKMTGGVRNPLGAIALYLGDTQFRIHGTNDAKSIGSAQSSGCFRMINSAALHLASLADVGTMVTVVDALPKMQGSVRPEVGAGKRDLDTVGSPDAPRSAR